MRMIVTALPSFVASSGPSSQVRLGFDAGHDTAKREPANRVAPRAQVLGRHDGQAYRRVAEARDEQRGVRQRRERRFEGRPADDTEHRRTDREPRVGKAWALDPGRPRGVARYERLNDGVVRPVRLHDRATVAAEPSDDLRPDTERVVPRTDARSAQRDVRVEDRDEIRVHGTEILHGVEAADDDLALGGSRRDVLRADAPHRNAREVADPLLHPFGTASRDAEVAGAAVRAASERL